MDFYPSEFPPEARDRIEKEKIRAYRELLPNSVYGFNEQNLAIRCIMRIFLAFAEEACALRKERGWTIERVERESKEFLRRLTITVVFDKFAGLDRYWISSWNGSIDSDVERRFRESAEWKTYEELLLTTPALAPEESKSTNGPPRVKEVEKQAPSMISKGKASQKFDRELFTLKLSELSHQMQIKSVASDRKANVASREAGGSFLVKSVDGQLALLGEWLEGVDRICREVWQTQGEAVTPDFVRDILVPEAVMLIEARAGSIMSGVTAVAVRTRLGDPYAAQHHLAMEIGKLKGEVTRRYEIEGRELKYREKVATGVAPAPAPPGEPSASATPASGKPKARKKVKIRPPVKPVWTGGGLRLDLERSASNTEDVKVKEGNAVAEFRDVLATGGGGRRHGWVSAALGMGVKRKNQGGRPRKDSERSRVDKLRSEGKTWGEIQNTLNHELNQKKSKDAYRALATRESQRRP